MNILDFLKSQPLLILKGAILNLQLWALNNFENLVLAVNCGRYVYNDIQYMYASIDIVYFYTVPHTCIA